MALRNPDRSGTPAGVFGAELRFHRTQAGLAQSELAEKTHVSHDVISKIETGERPPAEDFPPRLDAVPELNTHGELTRIWEHLRKGLRHRAYPGWFQRWADIEAEATALRWYESNLIPGLLQTEGYARAILAARPDSTDDDLDSAVAARMSRQAILEGERAPHLWVVLDEGALHRRIGSHKVMLDQLEHLAEMARRPKVSVQILPFEVGAHPGLRGAFVIADCDGATSMLYLETAVEGQTVEVPSVVAKAALVFDALRSEALPRRASLDLIMRVAGEKWNS
jgi:transcriptional regulator with XRE-family HTH domain